MASTPPSNEETVLYVLTSIENKGSVPRYAWIKTPRPALPINNLYMGAAYRYDRSRDSPPSPKTGFSVSRKSKGGPIENEEMAILLQPGEKIDVSFCIPHEPISLERAEKLAKESEQERYQTCKEPTGKTNWTRLPVSRYQSGE